MNQLILVVVLPLLAAFVTPIVERTFKPLGWLLGPATLLCTLWLLITLWPQLGDNPDAFMLGGFIPPLGISFYVDHLAMIFAVAVPILCLLLWPWQGAQSARVYSLMLLLAAACSALALSGDLFNLYVFYELVAVASFGLITLSGSGAAQVATFRYMLISGIGSVMTLTGIALIYTQTGTLNLAHLAVLSPQLLDNALGLVAFALILIGVGVKAELFPVNTWVPEVYATAPTRMTALLAGLVSKLAVLMIVRVLVLVFPQPEAHLLMLILGMIGVLSGEFAAWRSRDLRRVLAYSSIGQLGMIFVAFSIPGQAGLLAGLAIILHHMVVKPGLFMLVERWGGSIAGLAGAARVSPIGALLFVLFALSLIGVPPLPGFWAKLLLVSGLAGAGDGAYLLAMAVVLLATVVEANYFIRIMTRVYSRDDDTSLETHSGGSLFVSSFMAAGLITAMVMLIPVSAMLNTASTQASDVRTYVTTVFPNGITIPGVRP
jgi:formate hydrogenlyase subunit 3/multisubunit Na+/H+ antiporter MnhD subunit